MNRFPKMVILQYERALALGFPVWLAKAYGYAEAQKYAIFKTRRSYMPTKKKAETKAINPKKAVMYAMYKTDDIFKLFIDIDGYPIVGGKKITERDFDKYMSRFDKRTIDRLEAWAKAIIKPLKEELLRNEWKFFNYVWKPHRDDEI